MCTCARGGGDRDAPLCVHVWRGERLEGSMCSTWRVAGRHTCPPASTHAGHIVSGISAAHLSKQHHDIALLSSNQHTGCVQHQQSEQQQQHSQRMWQPSLKHTAHTTCCAVLRLHVMLHYRSDSPVQSAAAAPAAAALPAGDAPAPSRPPAAALARSVSHLAGALRRSLAGPPAAAAAAAGGGLAAEPSYSLRLDPEEVVAAARAIVSEVGHRGVT
jgi:hypothetical protein